VICIIAILCLRTKPKEGRESNGLLSSRSRSKRVRKRVEKVLERHGGSSEEEEGDVEKG